MNRHLISAVNALSRQTYKDWEIIVWVDRNSNSGSLEDQNEHRESLKLLRQLVCDDSRIRLLESDYPCDVFTGLNDCLKSVRGRYFKIMHPAETLHHDALEIMMRNFAEHQDVTHLTYGVEHLKPSQSIRLFPFCEELEKRRAEFSESFFSDGAAKGSAICSVFKSVEQPFQFDPNFRFFAEDIFLLFTLENGKSLHISNVLGVIDEQMPPSVIVSSVLQWLLLTGEIVILASTLDAKYLSPSFSAHATTITSALESEIFARYQNSNQETNGGEVARFRDVKGQSAEHVLRGLTATTYEKLRQVRDLEDSIHLNMVAVEQLNKDKAEKQLALDTLLKSRVWRYSEPLRSAKRIISRTLFSNK